MVGFVVSSSWIGATSSSSKLGCGRVVGWKVGGGARATVSRSQASRVVMDAGGSPPPVNLPSGALLGISSVLAIACVGCVFELTSGNPQYGTPVTVGILCLSFPAFIFSYYATIKKGQAEAEE